MKLQATCLRSLSVLVALGCGGEVANDSDRHSPGTPVAAAAETRSAPLSPLSDQQRLAVRDQVQARYFTTFTRLADQTALPRGRASLEIQYDAMRPRLLLKVQAASPTEFWSAVLPLEERDILSDRSQVALGGETTIRRLHQDKPVPATTPVQLILERSKDAGRRAMFHGELRDADGTMDAEFDTELNVSCFVPPEMLGVLPNGHGDSLSTASTLLVEDRDYASSYCTKFSSLL